MQETVDALKVKTGCEVVVMDVNDLRKVQILAASNGVDHKALTSVLLANPASNADEQTHLVLVRSLAVTKGGGSTPGRVVVITTQTGYQGTLLWVEEVPVRRLLCFSKSVQTFRNNIVESVIRMEEGTDGIVLQESGIRVCVFSVLFFLVGKKKN